MNFPALRVLMTGLLVMLIGAIELIPAHLWTSQEKKAAPVCP